MSSTVSRRDLDEEEFRRKVRALSRVVRRLIGLVDLVVVSRSRSDVQSCDDKSTVV